jgi:hypothetical protein
MLEALTVAPGRKVSAAQLREAFLEADGVRSSVGIACGTGAADAGVSTFEGDFAEFETDELRSSTPKRRSSQKAGTPSSSSVARKRRWASAMVGVERSGGDDGGAVGDEVIGKAGGIVADHYRLIEKLLNHAAAAVDSPGNAKVVSGILRGSLGVRRATLEKLEA